MFKWCGAVEDITGNNYAWPEQRLGVVDGSVVGNTASGACVTGIVHVSRGRTVMGPTEHVTHKSHYVALSNVFVCVQGTPTLRRRTTVLFELG